MSTAASDVEDKADHAPSLSNAAGDDDEKVKPQALSNFDVRVAIVGNVDSGKSTLIGVLTSGQLDDGRGLARSRIFMHRHELANGRTSCISQHILGFDEQHHVVNQPVPAMASAAQKNKSWREVVTRSRNTMTLIDLAGHERYLKTTIAGLTGCFPDYAIVVVGANMGISKMTKEHLGVCIALGIPIICVVTKVDMCPANVLEETKKQLYRILKSTAARKTPFHVRTEQDADACLSNMNARLCPIFFISSVTGENVDMLVNFLGRLPPNHQWADNSKNQNVEFRVDESFTVTGVGLVVSGTVSSGVLFENSEMMLGPFDDGSFRPVSVRTLHCKRVPVGSCVAGGTCAIALRPGNRKLILKRRDVRRGMIMVDPDHVPTVSRYFKAEVLVLHHPTTIRTNYQAVIHCGMVRQTATLKTMSLESLRTGDRAVCLFEFIQRPEVMHAGERLIFREGSTKGVGRVIEQVSEAEATVMIAKHEAEVAAKAPKVPNGEASSSAEASASASASASAASAAPRKREPPTADDNDAGDDPIR